MTTEFPLPSNIFLYSLLAIVCSLLFSHLSITIAKRFGLIDNPGRFAHKVHSTPTPLAGGTALISCLVLLTFLFGLFEDNFIRALVFSASIIYLFGLVDDARGLSAIPKLVGQILASSILIYSNVSVHFIGSISSSFLSPGLITILDTALTLFWLIGVTNAMNMIDSMDGIAIGISGIAFLFFILVTSLSRQVNLAEISIILLGITIGIYFFNVKPARMFLGDSGSQTLGFIIATIAMEYAPVGYSPISSWFVPILLVGMPIFDTSLVVYSRLLRKIPIYRANLDHTYHRLVALGFEEQRAVLAIHLAAILLSLVAFATFYLPTLIANIIFGIILFAGMILIVFFDRLNAGA